MCLEPFRVQTFAVYFIECLWFFFGNTQTELYDDYKQLMYGPKALPPDNEPSDSDAEIFRPCSNQHTPAAFDRLSEEEALNA